MSAPVVYLPHGGGPLPLLGDPAHAELAGYLRKLPQTLPVPSAIVVISAHWERDIATITSGASPPLIYDYSGFPAESYSIQYPAPGAPALAERLYMMLSSHGIDAVLDADRGFDHGLFVPLKLMYPNADIPCIQLSLLASLDARAHIDLGKALRQLLDEDVLVLGSGFSFHNMRAFYRRGPHDDIMNESFQQWLAASCSDDGVGEAERERRLIDWDSAPHARFCHPREEHLLPLHVCYGVAGTVASEMTMLNVIGKQACAFRW